MKMSELRKALKAAKIDANVDFEWGRSGSVYANGIVGVSIESAYNFLLKKEIFVKSSTFNQDLDCGYMICENFSHIRLKGVNLGFEIFKAYAAKIGCELIIDEDGNQILDDKVSDMYFNNHDINVLYSVIIDKCAEFGYTATFNDKIWYTMGGNYDTEEKSVEKFELQSARENSLLSELMSKTLGDKEEVVKRRKM